MNSHGGADLPVCQPRAQARKPFPPIKLGLIRHFREGPLERQEAVGGSIVPAEVCGQPKNRVARILGPQRIGFGEPVGDGPTQSNRPDRSAGVLLSSPKRRTHLFQSVWTPMFAEEPKKESA